MRKLGGVISGKLYEVKRQYPVLVQVAKGMRTVERELNRDVSCKCLERGFNYEDNKRRCKKEDWHDY